MVVVVLGDQYDFLGVFLIHERSSNSGRLGPRRMHRQFHLEYRVFAGAAADFDRAAVASDDFLADRQAHSSALVLIAPVETLERLEDQLGEFFLEADSRVFDQYLDLAVDAGSTL